MLVVLVLGMNFLAFGQEESPKNSLHGDMELECTVENGKVTCQVKTFITYGGKGKLGGYCWVQNSKDYNQAYCGPTYQVKPWLQVGGGIGAQTGENRFNAGAFVWVGKSINGKFVSNLFVVEKAGAWYRNVTSVQLNKRFTASLVEQRYSGIGPRVDIKLSKNLSAGVEVNFGESTKTKFGLKISF